MSKKSFSPQNLVDFGDNLEAWLVAHADQAKAVLDAINGALAALVAGSLSGTIGALLPLIAIVEGDIAAFQTPVSAGNRKATREASANLGANGAIIAAIIAALQAGKGQTLIAIIKAIIGLFGTTTTTP